MPPSLNLSLNGSLVTLGCEERTAERVYGIITCRSADKLETPSKRLLFASMSAPSSKEPMARLCWPLDSTLYYSARLICDGGGRAGRTYTLVATSVPRSFSKSIKRSFNLLTGVSSLASSQGIVRYATPSTGCEHNLIFKVPGAQIWISSRVGWTEVPPFDTKSEANGMERTASQ
jgi:hypothetical protein